MLFEAACSCPRTFRPQEVAVERGDFLIVGQAPSTGFPATYVKNTASQPLVAGLKETGINEEESLQAYENVAGLAHCGE